MLYNLHLYCLVLYTIPYNSYNLSHHEHYLVICEERLFKPCMYHIYNKNIQNKLQSCQACLISPFK
jgi:hypothetical protein